MVTTAHHGVVDRCWSHVRLTCRVLVVQVDVDHGELLAIRQPAQPLRSSTMIDARSAGRVQADKATSVMQTVTFSAGV